MYIFHLIWEKFGTKDVQKLLLNYCEFHENWSVESHIVLKGVSGFLSELRLFLYCLGEIWYKISVCSAVLSIFESVKIGGGKVKLYLWA